MRLCLLIVVLALSGVASGTTSLVGQINLWADDGIWFYDWSVNVATDGNRVAARGKSRIVVYDLDSGLKDVIELPAVAQDPVVEGSVALWSDCIIYGDSRDFKVWVVDIKTGNPIHSFDGPERTLINLDHYFGSSFAIRNDDLYISMQSINYDAYGGIAPGSVEKYSLQTGEKLWKLDHPGIGYSLWGMVVIPRERDVVIGSGYVANAGGNGFYAVVNSDAGTIEQAVSKPDDYPSYLPFGSWFAANEDFVFVGQADSSLWGARYDGGGGVLRFDASGLITGSVPGPPTGVSGLGARLALDGNILYASSNGLEPGRRETPDVLVIDVETMTVLDRIKPPQSDLRKFGSNVWLCDDYVVVYGVDADGATVLYQFDKHAPQTAAGSWELFD